MDVMALRCCTHPMGGRVAASKRKVNHKDCLRVGVAVYVAMIGLYRTIRLPLGLTIFLGLNVETNIIWKIKSLVCLVTK